jgi:hypothetical protein
MTTHDHRTETAVSPEEFEPATPRTEHVTERAASSTVNADPSPAQTESTIPEGQPSGAAAEAVPYQAPAPVTQSEPSTAPTEPAAAGREAPAKMTQGSRAESESPTDRSLFADDELAGLRARWDNVQAGFVDDPKECVHKADGLVSDVVGRLADGFTEARSRLEDQWARGEEASTEDLRLALRRYRDFFDRLLAV